MAKSVKLSDIADRVGVSIVTVSKALSGQKGVSDEMRERIKDLAEELGYVQPSVARRRAAQNSFNIGVLIRESYLDAYHSFYWSMYQQVTAEAIERDSFIMLEMVSQEMEKNKEIPKIISEQKIDGVLVLGLISDDYLQALAESTRIPVVFLDFEEGKQMEDAIVSDNFYGAYYLTNYLLEMGHRDIAYVGTLLATSSITDRYLGYSKSLIEHHIPFRPDWVIDDRDLDTAYIDEENLIQLPEQMPTAFFCNCDLTAAALVRKLEKNGYRVPEDISVVGYDNYMVPGLCDVEITTYEVNMKYMARKAVDILIRKLNHEDYVKGIHIVEGRLIEKGSVKKIN